MKNEYEIIDDYVVIQLSTGECIIDLADLEFVDREISNRIYVGVVGNGLPYAYYQKKVNGKRTSIKLHQLLMGTFGCGRGGDIVVDHIDGDSLNNRRNNLQITTQTVNVRKSRISNTNTSGHRNIVWRENRKRYQVQFWRNGKTQHFGYYRELDEALKVRDEFLKNEVPRPKEVIE
jgi:hypothetical protein